MAFDGTGSDATPIGTFSSDLKGMGKAIDCRNDGTKVTNPIYLLKDHLKDFSKCFSLPPLQNAVTHKDKSSKNSVVATWTPPEDFDGTVVFK